MTWLKRFRPEIVSFLTSGIALAGLAVLLGVVAPFLVALICARFYYLAKRPRMWAHLPIQAVSFLVLFLFPIWPSYLSPVLAAAIMLAVTLPAIAVCSLYQLRYAKRLGKNPN